MDTASLFSASSLTTDNLPCINTSTVWNLAQPNLQTTKEFAKFEANFATIDINNSHITCRKSKSVLQTPDQIERSLLLPVWFEMIVMIKEQYLVQPYHWICICWSSKIFITSPWVMQVTILWEWGAISIVNKSHILDYFDDPVLDSAVISAGDFLFWNSKKEVMYTEVFGTTQQETFSWLQSGTMISYWVTEILHYILPLDPESPVKTTSEILVTAPQLICSYHIQIPMTHFTQHTMKGKEMLSRICKSK